MKLRTNTTPQRLTKKARAYFDAYKKAAMEYTKNHPKSPCGDAHAFASEQTKDLQKKMYGVK